MMECWMEGIDWLHKGTRQSSDQPSVTGDAVSRTMYRDADNSGLEFTHPKAEDLGHGDCVTETSSTINKAVRTSPKIYLDAGDGGMEFTHPKAEDLRGNYCVRNKKIQRYHSTNVNYRQCCCRCIASVSE